MTAADLPPELPAAFDVMPCGLLVFDAADRLLLANAAAAAVAHVDASRLGPGMRLRDVVRLFAFRGVYGPGDPERQVAEQLALDRSRPLRRLLRRTDGIAFDVQTTPLPQGGLVVLLFDVSPLTVASAAAAARVRQLEDVLARLHGGIALFDVDHHLTVHNPAYEALIGLPHGPVRRGMSYDALLQQLVEHGEFANADAELLFSRRRAIDRTRPLVYARERPGGEVVRFESQPMPDGGFLIEVADITALKRAEDEATRRAALLDGVLAALPHGIGVWGPDRRVALRNAAYGEIMQGAPVQIGDELSALIRARAAAGEYGPGDPDSIYEAQMRIPLDRPQRRRRIRPNGAAIEIRTAPLPDGGHISVVTDITPLHEAEAEASRRAAMLQAMLDNIRHGICLFGPDRRVLAANAMAVSLSGYAPGLLRPGTPLEELVASQVASGEFGSPGDAADYARLVLGRDRAIPSRTIRTRPNGVVLEIDPDPTPDGGFVTSYTDITDDRRIRVELERAKEAAEAASLAKSRFLATMSHELRTPLNAVIGFSEALRGGGIDPADRTEFVEAIHEAGRHLLALIDDILDAARVEGGGFAVEDAPVDPAALIEASVRVMRGTATAAGVTLSVAPSAMPRLRGDERRLRQVLLNLLSNAVKFTPEGGTVSLASEIDAVGDLLIRVRDTGIGMPPVEIPRAFEAFVQLDASLARRFSGSGLGLYLSRALTEAQGGTLTLDSVPGQGTTATLRFPRDRLLPI